MRNPLQSRRTVVGAAGAALALSACGPSRGQPTRPLGPVPALKAVASAPVGVCAMTAEMDDPAWTGLALRQFSQLTPEWEFQMQSVLADDGTFRFDRADRIAAFVRANRLGLHGTSLVWYAQDPVAFRRIDADRAKFAPAYRSYILAVAGRYRGLARGWDVVNEPVAEDGAGYRDCLWRRNFGMDYVRLAFEHAREADPGAVLFLNDYNLETRPAKLDAFLRLVEDLLKAGAPLGGLGTQTHVPADLAPGAISRTIAALSRFGLPIHVSEIDVSIRGKGGLLASPDEMLKRQARVFGEAAEAFAGLPARQRYAFTTWGARDRDSWLRRAPNAGDGSDRPLLFDDAGQPKPAFLAVARALQSAARPSA